MLRKKSAVLPYWVADQVRLVRDRIFQCACGRRSYDWQSRTSSTEIFGLRGSVRAISPPEFPNRPRVDVADSIFDREVTCANIQ
jgi:hypothetical protein